MEKGCKTECKFKSKVCINVKDGYQTYIVLLELISVFAWHSKFCSKLTHLILSLKLLFILKSK